MTITRDSLFEFDNSFARELVGMYEPSAAAIAPEPRLLVLNESLADELGLDPVALASDEGVEVLAGRVVPPGATPVAQAYSGHQFGGFSPRLGDGRALLLGEVFDRAGNRRDLHLKGSGRTVFARGGDGKAAVGPMLREYVIGEALHALGIPTTRALAVVATGERIARTTPLPGAVLTRVAASHLRVGSFQYAAAHSDLALVRRVADYAIARHYPQAALASNRYLALLASVVEAQAKLVARWMCVGFIHGVMNTDNTTISGESIDFGPCAFMDTYDAATVFSSIDHGGRYAYANQPGIVQWNLARLAETLLALIDENDDRSVELATAAVVGFGDRYTAAWTSAMLAKIGVIDARADDDALLDSLFTLLQDQRVDFTTFFRALATAVRGELAPVHSLFDRADAFDAWAALWGARRQGDRRHASEVAAAMDAINPIYIARNHLVEEALDAASTSGDLDPMRRLVVALRAPFVERAGFERYAQPAPTSFGKYQTFCGT